ncbi:hypothetical protein CRYUN_Cryun28dG0017300 [Craigia yunnanensis]
MDSWHKDSLDGAVTIEEDVGADESSDVEEPPFSAIAPLFQSYKKALASNDESKVADIKAFLKSIEDEKVDLEKKMASLLEELSIEKYRILRISADFDNFPKRTDRKCLLLTHTVDTRKHAFRWLGLRGKLEKGSIDSLVLHESKKMVFGTDVTNNSFKRNKVHSSNDLNFN